jgi:hypothetical protein
VLLALRGESIVRMCVELTREGVAFNGGVELPSVEFLEPRAKSRKGSGVTRCSTAPARKIGNVAPLAGGR